MSRPRHQRISELFLEACRLQGRERQSFLERACEGDFDLRAEVESLLEHDGDEIALLETGRGPDHLARFLVNDGHTPIVDSAVSKSSQACRVYGGRIPDEFDVCPSCDSAVSREESIPHIPGYEIQRLIGVGGMGQVYLAEEIALGRQVAIKIVSPSPESQRQAHRRFTREARTLARVEHPNIVRVYAFGEAEGRSYLAMEYVEGEGLSERIRRSGHLDLDEALGILLQTVNALDAAWGHGIVHRDIKPSNILIDRKQQVRVADFGLAKTTRSKEDPTITLTGIMVGTPYYMAPEQARGTESPDFRSDVYSLGIVLYEMLTGKPPFRGASPIAVAAQQIQVALPPLAADQPDLDDDLQALCEWMTRKNPQDRPGSYTDLQQCIDALRRGVRAPIARRPALPSFLAADREQAQQREDAVVFVGREEELNRLSGYLDYAVSGHGRVVFVTGEAGCGKTALLAELTRRSQADLDDLIVARGNCKAQTGTGDPYLPFREVLSLLTGDVEAKWASATLTLEHARRLWDLLPISAEVLVDSGPDLVGTFLDSKSLVSRAAAHSEEGADWRTRLEILAKRKALAPADAGQQQYYLLEQFARTLRGLARKRPLLLEVEDLHWADPGSCSLLAHLGRSISDSRILVVGTYRPAETTFPRDGQRHPLEALLSEFKRQFGDHELNLDRETSPEFSAALLDVEPNLLDDGFRQSLYHRTKGHPLFTLELLRFMRDRSMLVQDEQGIWVEGSEIDWETLPAQVEGVIEDRIGRLPDRLRRLLDAASVQGEEFIAEVLAASLGTGERETVTLLSRELDKQYGLVQAQRVQRVNGRRVSHYSFRPILFREYLYGRMDEVERTYSHEEIGHALESLYGDRASEVSVQLALHFGEAQITDKAIDYLRQAGERATMLSANEEAIAHLSKGLEMLESIDDDEQRKRLELGLQLAFGAPLMSSAGPGSSALSRAYTRARELCDEVGEPRQLFQALFVLIHYHASQCELRKTLALAEELLGVVEGTSEPLPTVLAHWARAFALFYLGELGEARAEFERILAYREPYERRALAGAFGTDPESSGLAYLSTIRWFQGEPESARECVERALDLVRKLDHGPSLAHTMIFVATLAALERDRPWLEQASDDLYRIANDHGALLFRAWAGFYRGRLLVFQGRPEESIETTRAAIKAIRGTGSQLALPALMISLAEASAAAGRPQEGLDHLRDAMTSMQRTDERLHEAEAHIVRGRILLERAQPGDEREAEASFARSIEVARRQGARSWELRSAIDLAELWARQDRSEEARNLLTEVRGGFPEGARLADLERADELLNQIG